MKKIRDKSVVTRELGPGTGQFKHAMGTQLLELRSSIPFQVVQRTYPWLARGMPCHDP